MSVDDLIHQNLWQQISQHQGVGLWVVDENLAGQTLPRPPEGLEVLTNRFDVYQEFVQAGWPCRFNDFDFSVWPNKHFDCLYYRVSKEKAVVNYIINAALDLLKPEGQFYLLGAKNEGTKTYFDKSRELFNDAYLEKLGKGSFMGALQQPAAANDEKLDDRDYEQLRPVQGLDCDGQPVLSKPGLFGWDKIDAGSAFLIEQLPGVYAQLGNPKPSVLDLGCGYGYLSTKVWEQGASNITATDNNAAAVLCCSQNFEQLGITGEVIADNCAAGISGEFDLIVCNPPFHQGFSVEGDLTNRFIATAKRLLAPQGKAVFVVNRFIPLENKARSSFNSVETLAENKGFKVVLLAQS